MTDKETQNLKRWRLILGKESDEMLGKMAGDNSVPMSQTDIMIDSALQAIYGTGEGSFDDNEGGKKCAGKGGSSPVISKWLGDIRKLFDKETIKIIQDDAIERKNLKELLMEPEILNDLEPDVNIVSTLLMLKDQIPQKSKAAAREFIKRLVEEVNKLLENDIRSSVTAAINKREHSAIPSASAIDFKYTIRRNLKNFNPDLKIIVPEKVWFFDRRSSVNKWNIILDIDQSGSMGESIIYSSIVSCILASMSSIQTNVVAFDTQIMDLTSLCEDPVDLLYGFQMGGGTDIDKSIAYCQTLITDPQNTLFFLISDLEEYGGKNFINRLNELKESGATVIVLLAIADGGRASYDENNARRIASLGIPCFACPPDKLPELLQRALSKDDLTYGLGKGKC